MGLFTGISGGAMGSGVADWKNKVTYPGGAPSSPMPAVNLGGGNGGGSGMSAMPSGGYGMSTMPGGGYGMSTMPGNVSGNLPLARMPSANLGAPLQTMPGQTSNIYGMRPPIGQQQNVYGMQPLPGQQNIYGMQTMPGQYGQNGMMPMNAAAMIYSAMLRGYNPYNGYY